MKPIPLVRRAVIASAVSYLASGGVSVDRYLRRANLSAPSPENLNTLIPFQQVCDFLRSAARGEGIDDLGFRIGGHQGTKCLGLFGRLLAQALTIHETIQISSAVVSAHNSGLQVWMERHDEQARYCHKFVDSLPREGTTEVEHLGLAIALANAGYGHGASWRPTRIDLAADPIDLATYFPGLAGVPVRFNQPYTSIWADQAVLSQPLRSHDAAGRTIDEHEQALFMASGPAVEPTSQLEQAVESVLGHPGMSLQLTAAIIGMSPRTLQRRLAEVDTSFSRVVQAVRFRTAQRLLHDPDMHLKEIAKRLGYTDLANFMRAFKRWTGVSPAEFRRLHYGDKAK